MKPYPVNGNQMQEYLFVDIRNYPVSHKNRLDKTIVKKPIPPQKPNKEWLG